MSDVLFDTKHYLVRQRESNESILGEDGAYTISHSGYVVVNKETDVIEHTTTMLPGAIFQCQHFNDTLVGLLNPEVIPDVDLNIVDVPEDVVPN